MTDFVDAVLSRAAEFVGQGPKWSPGGNAVQRTFRSLFGWSLEGVDFCAAQIMVAAREAGVPGEVFTGSTLVSLNVREMQRNGTWLGLERPQRGDVVVFTWSGRRTSQNVADDTDHIGLVWSVDGDTITTLEGNNGYDSTTGFFTYRWDSSVIYGYGRPFAQGHVQGGSISIGENDMYEVSDRARDDNMAYGLGLVLQSCTRMEQRIWQTQAAVDQVNWGVNDAGSGVRVQNASTKAAVDAQAAEFEKFKETVTKVVGQLGAADASAPASEGA